MGHNVWAVIRREYLQRVRSKRFIFTTLLVPVLMIGLVAVPIVLEARGQQAERRVAVVDQTDVLLDRMRPELEGLGWSVQEEPWRDGVVDELRQRADAGDIASFLVLDDHTLETGEATYYTEEAPSPVRRLTLGAAVSRAVMGYHLEQGGADAALLQGGDITVEVLGGGGAENSDAAFALGYMGAMILYVIILLYSVAVMRATLEEKTSRIVEVVISSMKPWHLLLGKILGVGAVGLTQLAIWIGFGTIAATAGLSTLMAARPELTQLENIRDVLPGLGLLVLFGGFFLLGYFMFSGLYAAVGAMCNTDEEAQQSQFPVIIFIVAPIMMLAYVIRNSTTAAATALSLFPLFSPILMWGRVAGGGVPAWQVALSFVLMALTVVAIAWIAGRIYKVGILMTGKRPTLPELWRWVRAA